MTVFMVEGTKPNIPTFCIWKCWCGKTSEPVSWEGRWDAYSEAQKAEYEHIRKKHKGRRWPNSKITVDQLDKDHDRELKRRRKRLKKSTKRGGW